jgi:hypothetical protein
MFVRPPQLTRPSDKDPLAAALEQEIVSEKASTLARLTQKLEKALADLAFLQENPQLTAKDRERGLAQAGEALWHVTIQRELCGLRQHRAFYDFLGVPPGVRLRMGPAGSVRPTRGSSETDPL